MSDQATLDISAEFPILREMTFLNHAGVSPISGRASEALQRFAEMAATRAYLHPGWYRRVEEVKKLAARLINAQGEHEIAFIPNTSTGLSTVAKGIDWCEGDNVLLTNVEFPANRYPWEDLKRFGVELIAVDQHPDGCIEVEDVVEAVTSRTRVVAISHVQYASGCCIDLRPISDMVHMAGGYLCVDAIQSTGVMPIDVAAMGIDFLSADGHKWLLSPEGCGFLYCREDLVPLLHPNVVGWRNMVDPDNYGDYQFKFQSDARRFEAGSYNIPGIMAMGASIELLLEVGIDHVWERVEALTTRLCEGLCRKDYRIYSPRGDGERSGIVVFDPPSPDTRLTPPLPRIVSELEKRDMVLVAREGRLRASPHFYNTLDQIDAVVDALP